MRRSILTFCYLLILAFGVSGETIFPNPTDWRYSEVSVLSVSDSDYLLESHLDYYIPGTIGFRIQAVRLATLPLPRSNLSLGVVAWPGFVLGALSSAAYFQLNNMGPGSGIGYPLLLGYVSALGAINDFVFHPQMFAVLPGNLKVGVGYDIDWFPTEHWLSFVNAYTEITIGEELARPENCRNGSFFGLTRISLGAEWNDRINLESLKGIWNIGFGIGYKL